MMTNDMTQGRIVPILVKFTIPLVLGNLLQLTYNAVDSIIVGRYVGKEALAAVGTSNPLLTLIILSVQGILSARSTARRTTRHSSERSALRCSPASRFRWCSQQPRWQRRRMKITLWSSLFNMGARAIACVILVFMFGMGITALPWRSEEHTSELQSQR